MKEEFIKKLNNKEYISKYLYLKVQKEIPSLIPNNFNLDTYNNEVLASDQIKYKDYFQNMYNNIDTNIHLDEDQIKAILTDEEYSLIIAGAGTGKTTTMASKIKYLVDIKKIPPNEILAISFTKKATEELQKRIVVDFNIPAEVTTFHSLGLMYIREIFKPHKCYVVDKNIRNSIFLEYFKENIFPYKNKVKEDINRVRDKVDLLIVAMHWGIEYTHIPTSYQIDMANYLSSLGVDIIIGTHPHVVMPITYINDTLVIYSLGNFLSAQETNIDYNTTVGLLSTVKITKHIDKDNNTSIKLSNQTNELIYTYSKNNKDYKVIPFSNPDIKTYLSDYERVYNKYASVIKNMDNTIEVNSIN